MTKPKTILIITRRTFPELVGSGLRYAARIDTPAGPLLLASSTAEGVQAQIDQRRRLDAERGRTEKAAGKHIAMSTRGVRGL